MAQKSVTDIIIAKDVSSGNNGYVRALKGDMSAILGASATVLSDPIIYIEQTLADTSKKILSLPIHGKFVKGWYGKSAANATLHQITVSAPNVISDQEYGLFIHFASDKEMAQGNRRYYVQYFSDSSATVAEIAAGIAAAVNATSFPLAITAAVTGGNAITLTADRPGDYFSVGKAVGFDSSVTVSISANADPGQGTYDQIYRLEEATKGYKGYLGERRTFVGDLPGFSRPDFYTTGTALSITGVYDTYVIEHDSPHKDQVPNSLQLAPQITYICVPAGWGQQSTFETAMNSYMNSLGFASVTL